MGDNTYLVCTKCMTFNHAPYIVDAINGFCMQETSFPVVHVIIDDASTDGEPEIIQKYLEENFNLQDNRIVRREDTDDYKLIFTQHNTNKHCYFAVIFLKYNHYSIKKDKRPYYKEWEENAKYIAVCEGDDYWTDRVKLQRQVDYLNLHNECIAVAENGIELNINTGKSDLFNKTKEDIVDYTLEELLLERRFPTASVMYRSTLNKTERFINMKCRHDTAMWCCFASIGKVRFFNTNSSVYRRGSGITVTTERLKWAQITEEWYLYLLDYFKEYISNDTKYQVMKLIYNHYLVVAAEGIKRHDKEERYIAIEKLNYIGISSHVLFDVTEQYLKELKNNLKFRIKNMLNYNRRL